MLNRKSGFSLIEVLIVIGILGVTSLALVSLMDYARSSSEGVRFLIKREQLRTQIITQVLNNPNNCRCIFANSTPFPSTGIAALPNSVPVQAVRNYELVGPSDCGTAVPRDTFIDTINADDGVRATEINLLNITNIMGQYSGELTIRMSTQKKILGLSNLDLIIPVNINTTGAGPGTVRLANCSLSQPISTTAPATPAVSPIFGGTGGAGSLTCPPGTYANGVRMRSGGYVDAIQLKCSDSSMTPMRGGTGGWLADFSCPAGLFLTRFDVRSAGYVDFLRAYCSQLDGTGLVAIGQGGGTGGGPSNFSCPTGMAIGEARVRTGGYVDSISFICR